MHTSPDTFLAVERALTDAERERILGKFRNSNLNGAAVADILDILDNGDALLELREPFYDGGSYTAMHLLGWGHASYLQFRLIGLSCLAVAILTDRVPTAGAVAHLALRAYNDMEQDH